MTCKHMNSAYDLTFGYLHGKSSARNLDIDREPETFHGRLEDQVERMNDEPKGVSHR